MTYLIFKLIHVIAVVLFLGNIITGLFWKFHADGAPRPKVIAHAFAGIIRADRWFTVPSVMIIVAAGIGAAIQARFPILGTGWIFWSLCCSRSQGLSFQPGCAFAGSHSGLALKGAEKEEMDWHLYHRLSRSWEFWGLAAIVTPIAAVALMVLKPALPGL